MQSLQCNTLEAVTPRPRPQWVGPGQQCQGGWAAGVRQGAGKRKGPGVRLCGLVRNHELLSSSI